MRKPGWILFAASLALGIVASAQGVHSAHEGLSGTVTSVTADHMNMTIKTATGETFSVILTKDTRLFERGMPNNVGKLDHIKVGGGVGLVGTLEGNTYHPVSVVITDAESSKSMFSQGMGKTDVMGKVAAIDGTKLTITRADNLTQVIEVDENTAFRAGPMDREAYQSGKLMDGKTITLADIKTGDRIYAKGALKGDVFVPAQLKVVVRRQQPGGSDAGSTEPKP